MKIRIEVVVEDELSKSEKRITVLEKVYCSDGKISIAGLGLSIAALS